MNTDGQTVPFIQSWNDRMGWGITPKTVDWFEYPAEVKQRMLEKSAEILSQMSDTGWLKNEVEQN